MKLNPGLVYQKEFAKKILPKLRTDRQIRVIEAKRRNVQNINSSIFESLSEQKS